MPSNIMSYIG